MSSATKASASGEKTKSKKRTERRRAPELAQQVLELQHLRRLVRIAECGRALKLEEFNSTAAARHV